MSLFKYLERNIYIYIYITIYEIVVQMVTDSTETGGQSSGAVEF